MFFNGRCRCKTHSMHSVRENGNIFTSGLFKETRKFFRITGMPLAETSHYLDNTQM